MAKTSGGTRRNNAQKATRIVPFKESEKAVQVEMLYETHTTAFGGVSSQFGGDREYEKRMVWIPKNQIEDGNISEWIAKQKAKEIEDWANAKRINTRLNVSNTSFFDASGRKITVASSKREREWVKERDAKRAAALTRVSKEREELISKATANGYKAHSRMSTATLTRMARGTYQSGKERKIERLKVRIAATIDQEIRNRLRKQLAKLQGE